MGLLQQDAIQINCTNLHNANMISHAEVFSGLCKAVCIEQIRFITSYSNLSRLENLPANLFGGGFAKGAIEKKNKRFKWN